MATFTALGGFGEVGRQSFLIETADGTFMFDHGVNVENSSVPIQSPTAMRAVFLSHAHLDHSGNVPSLYARGYSNSVYATPVTIDLATLLVEDSHKVQKIKGQLPLYELDDVLAMQHMARRVGYGQPMDFGKTTATFFDAGHTPGSAMTLLQENGRNILYTGDIKFSATELSNGAFRDYRNIDTLIIESTYSHMDHPNRRELKKELRSYVQQVISNNGSVIIPVFAVGRSQDMLMMLYDLGIPIYMDGMGIKATRITLHHPHFLSDHKKLHQAFSIARKIKGDRQRQRVLDKPCIVLTSAGMLQGGPVRYYARKIMKRKECSMIINGFQMGGTPGRTLLDTGRYVDEEVDAKPDFQVKFMDFSVHAGRTGLLRFIKELSPQNIILTHGSNTEGFAAELSSIGFQAIAPLNGDRIRI